MMFKRECCFKSSSSPSGNSVSRYNDRCLARWFNTPSQITAMKIFQLTCLMRSPRNTNLSFLSAVKLFQSQSLWVVASHWLTLVKGRNRGGLISYKTLRLDMQHGCTSPPPTTLMLRTAGLLYVRVLPGMAHVSRCSLSEPSLNRQAPGRLH